MTPDPRLLKQFNALARLALRRNFYVFNVQEMVDAAMCGDRKTFRTLRKNAMVAIARDLFPELAENARRAALREYLSSARETQGDEDA